MSMGFISTHKGTIFVSGALAATLVLGALVVVTVRSETIKLVDRARMMDATVADHVRMVRGVGGVGRYMVILPDVNGRPLELTRCPLNINNAICVVLP